MSSVVGSLSVELLGLGRLLNPGGVLGGTLMRDVSSGGVGGRVGGVDGSGRDEGGERGDSGEEGSQVHLVGLVDALWVGGKVAKMGG